MHFDGFDVDAGLQAPIAEAMLVNPRSAAATAMVHLSPNALEASRGVFEVPGCGSKREDVRLWLPHWVFLNSDELDCEHYCYPRLGGTNLTKKQSKNKNQIRSNQSSPLLAH